MPQLNEAAILEALKSVRDPDRGADIVSLGMISGLVLKQGNVGFSIEVAPERGARAGAAAQGGRARRRRCARGAVGDRGAHRA